MIRSLKEILKQNRGSMLVEGAIIIPMILLLVFSAIFMLLDFYVMVVNETINNNAVFLEGFNEADSIRKAAVLEKLL